MTHSYPIPGAAAGRLRTRGSDQPSLESWPHDRNIVSSLPAGPRANAGPGTGPFQPLRQGAVVIARGRGNKEVAGSARFSSRGHTAGSSAWRTRNPLNDFRRPPTDYPRGGTGPGSFSRRNADKFHRAIVFHPALDEQCVGQRPEPIDLAIPVAYLPFLYTQKSRGTLDGDDAVRPRSWSAIDELTLNPAPDARDQVKQILVDTATVHVPGYADLGCGPAGPIKINAWGRPWGGQVHDPGDWALRQSPSPRPAFQMPDRQQRRRQRKNRFS